MVAVLQATLPHVPPLAACHLERAPSTTFLSIPRDVPDRFACSYSFFLSNEFSLLFVSYRRFFPPGSSVHLPLAIILRSFGSVSAASSPILCSTRRIFYSRRFFPYPFQLALDQRPPPTLSSLVFSTFLPPYSLLVLPFASRPRRSPLFLRAVFLWRGRFLCLRVYRLQSRLSSFSLAEKGTRGLLQAPNAPSWPWGFAYFQPDTGFYSPIHRCTFPLEILGSVCRYVTVANNSPGNRSNFPEALRAISAAAFPCSFRPLVL